MGNAELLKKVYLAKLVFPLAAVLSNIMNFLLSLIPLVVLIFALRFPFHWTWVYLPVAMVSLVLFTLGACFFFATANVFYRDVSHSIQIILSAWFYFTPVVYSLDLIPEKYRWLFHLNPMGAQRISPGNLLWCVAIASVTRHGAAVRHSGTRD